jgi:hypothetical protein
MVSRSRRGAAGAASFAAVALAGVLAAVAGAAAPGNGRAWELVTPSEPVSATISAPVAIEASGERLLYSSENPMPGAPAGDPLAQNLAVREAGGWRSEPVGAPYTVPKFDFNTLFGPVLMAASVDLASFVYVAAMPLTPDGPPVPQFALYRITRDGASLIAAIGNRGRFGGASADTAHVVFQSEEHLLPSDAGRTTGASVYESVGATLRQVDVADDDSLLSECGSELADDGSVSDSGERIFFANPARFTCSEPVSVYVREAGSKTVEVSASECGCDFPQDAKFAGSTPSGSVAFLVTAERLVTADANSLADLYRFDLGSRDLSLVSPGSPAAGGGAAEEPVTTSDDGSSTYFQGRGLLPGDDPAMESGLYLADDLGVRLVAPIQPQLPPEISADGRTALIATESQLVAGDTDAESDVYRYDADQGSITRLSAGPAGGNGPFAATARPVSARGGSLRQGLSEDGRRAFFSTAESLLTEDRNEATDVYEWFGGALSLVSSGQGSDPAEFASTSPDGSTVLFRTAASLLPRDRDGGDLDLYAARIGGGFDESQPVPGCGPCAVTPVRLERREAASARAPGRRRKGRIRLRLGPHVAREIAATGRTVLELRVPAPGRVSARARGLLGGKLRTVAGGEAGAVRPGSLGLQLATTPAARSELVREGVLRFRLLVRQAELRLSRVITLRLGGKR